MVVQQCRVLLSVFSVGLLALNREGLLELAALTLKRSEFGDFSDCRVSLCLTGFAAWQP
jgi:hypothetical protein